MFLPVKRLMRHDRLPVYMPGATYHHNIWHDRNRLYISESLMPPYGFANSTNSCVCSQPRIFAAEKSENMEMYRICR